jgi:hypothetical protein
MFTLLLSKRLRRAGRREIGGILMGKQVAHDPVMPKMNS